MFNSLRFVSPAAMHRPSLRRSHAGILVFSTALAACGSTAGDTPPDSTSGAPAADASTPDAGSHTPTPSNGPTHDGAADDGGAPVPNPPTGDGGPADGSTSGDGSNGKPSDAGGTFIPAAHPPVPHAVNSGGGVLAAPQIVPITYPGDPLVTSIEAFAAQVGTSAYWTAVTSEYGIGKLTSGAPVHLTESPPATIDDAEIDTWLQSSIGTTLPAPAPGLIYAIFYPAGTSVTLEGATSCGKGFGGYHKSTLLTSGEEVVYAVMPRCTYAPTPDVDTLTGVTSHELVEATSDPYPLTRPAYFTVDPDHFAWSFIVNGGGELGDLCEARSDAFFRPAGFPFAVQRTWSNASASAGHDTCVPAAPGAYFNSATPMDDALTISYQGNSYAVKGVKLAVGQSRTVDVALFSDAPTAGPWTVATGSTMTGSSPDLSFSFDKTQGVNGDHLKLTITANKFNAQLNGTGAAFAVVSTLGTQSYGWYGFVGN